jgi:hypothetical protein
MTAQLLAEEFLKDLQNLKQHEKVLEAAQNLEKALVSNNRLLMQLQLKAYVETLSDIILESSTKVITAETFTSLGDKGKAVMVRDYLSLGPKLGYAEAATATTKVYRELLKSSGITASPVAGKMDPERLKGAVAGSIKHAIENDGKLESTLKDSFSQLIRAGNRDTVDETSRKVKSRTGDSILVQRVTGADPCKYCEDHSGVWFHADSQDTFSRYHDNCKCRIDMKIGKLTSAEKALDPNEYSYDEIRAAGDSELEDIDDFEDFD